MLSSISDMLYPFSQKNKIQLGSTVDSLKPVSRLMLKLLALSSGFIAALETPPKVWEEHLPSFGRSFHLQCSRMTLPLPQVSP